jgi:DNA invertase Pin-like site-specific DNA recombinase
MASERVRASRRGSADSGAWRGAGTRDRRRPGAGIGTLNWPSATRQTPAYGATLVIAKIDRLSRDAHFLLGLQKAGVRFVAADMPEANEMVVGIMAVVAQGERRMISERTKAALQAAKSRGIKLGGFRGVVPSDNDRKAATAAVKARAKARAADLAPIVAEIKASGQVSLGDLARSLTTRGIPTPRGSSQWTATAASRLLRLIGETRHSVEGNPFP